MPRPPAATTAPIVAALTLMTSMFLMPPEITGIASGSCTEKNR